MRAGSRVTITAKKAVSYGMTGTVSTIDTEHYEGKFYRPIAVRMDDTGSVQWWTVDELMEMDPS